MGKRKSKARVMKKARAAVDTTFDCPFCNHKQTVECKLNYNTNLGNIKCRVCGVAFQSEIHHLSDPIDVYSEWIDQTEQVNAAVAKEETGARHGGDEDDEDGQSVHDEEE